MNHVGMTTIYKATDTSACRQWLLVLGGDAHLRYVSKDVYDIRSGSSTTAGSLYCVTKVALYACQTRAMSSVKPTSLVWNSDWVKEWLAQCLWQTVPCNLLTIKTSQGCQSSSLKGPWRERTSDRVLSCVQVVVQASSEANVRVYDQGKRNWSVQDSTSTMLDCTSSKERDQCHGNCPFESPVIWTMRRVRRWECSGFVDGTLNVCCMRWDERKRNTRVKVNNFL